MSSPLTHLSDFSDLLSPMLVKELRQGMRARSFTMLFLIFQLLLCFILITAGSSAESGNAGSVSSGIIFTLFIIAVIFIQPMRGVTALSSEIKDNTIEMMVLTRLSAARIVFGKWIAIVSQSALLLITIIPYLILRYFFGGMLLVGELVFLALIFMTSMALTAVMVGLSGNAGRFARVVPVICFIFLLQLLPRFLMRGSSFETFIGFCTLSNIEARVGILSYILFISYMGWCALSYGISSIAPAADNHSTLRRLITLGLALIAAFVGLHRDVPPQVLLAILAIIISPAVITALTEPAILFPPICTPFVKRGVIGKFLALFLLPGWPTGVLYTTLLAIVTLAGITISWASKSYPYFEDEIIIFSLACFGTVLFSALLAVYFCKQEIKRFHTFMIFLLVSIALAVLPSILLNINGSENLLWIFVWNPPMWIFMMNDNKFIDSQVMITAIITCSIYLMLLIISAVTAIRRYWVIMQDSENELRKPAVIDS